MPNKKPMHIYSIQISKEWFYQNTRRKCAVNIQRSDSDVIRWKVISMRSTTVPWITVRQMPLHCSITGYHRQSRDLTTRLLLSPQLCPVLCSVCIFTWFSYLLSDIVCVQCNLLFQPLAVKYCTFIIIIILVFLFIFT